RTQNTIWLHRFQPNSAADYILASLHACRENFGFVISAPCLVTSQAGMLAPFEVAVFLNTSRGVMDADPGKAARAVPGSRACVVRRVRAGAGADGAGKERLRRDLSNQG